MRALISLLIAAGVAVLPRTTHAETRRALLIGINEYSPASVAGQAQVDDAASSAGPGRERIPNLRGCVNDVTALREMLIGRYGFKAGDIQVLVDRQATRAAILQAIQNHLVDSSVSGDIAVFFYAGHGSRIRNLRTNKPSGMDSTIVPVDAGPDVMDIRDKELSRVFGKALDKGALLTAIFDSCHSGSIARGLPKHSRGRDLPPDLRTVSDPPDPGPTPDQRGALILSATQDDMTAVDGEDDHGVPQGAFTAALVKALRSAPRNASADEVFLRTESQLEASEPGQVPAMAGTPERRKKPWLGETGPMDTGLVLVGVISSDRATQQMTLGGGQTIGLELGCELHRLPRVGEQNNGAATERIQIIRVQGLARSAARLLSGNMAQIEGGDLFVVDRWALPKASPLRVWLNESDMAADALERLGPELEALHHANSITWITDPTTETPARLVSWSKSAWALSGAGKLGTKWRAQDVLKKLAASGSEPTKLFVDIPAPRELARELKLGAGTANPAVQVSPDAAGADYQLTGRWENGKPQFAWVRPQSTADSSNALPARTDWEELGANGVPAAARALESTVARLARLKAWLTLNPPPNTAYFPYRLELRHAATGRPLRPGDSVVDGETNTFALVADPSADLGVGTVGRQWVYVFGMNQRGQTALIFPKSMANVENHLPLAPPDPSQTTYPREYLLQERGEPAIIEVTDPFGIDTFFLLTAGEPIPQPAVLNNEGVQTRGGQSDDPVQRLLGSMGPSTRGDVVPTEWSLQRVMVRSEPLKGK